MTLAKSGSSLLRIAGGGGVIAISSGSDGLYDLGDIPARFEAVEWADQPVTTNNVSVNNQSQLNAAVVSGNQVTLNAGTYTDLTIPAGTSDVHVICTGRTIGGGIPFIGSSAIRRIKVTGGTFATGGTDAEVLLNSDIAHVTFDNVRMGAISTYDFSVPGTYPHHVSVINSTIRAGTYCLLGNINHDWIFANVDMETTSSDSAALRYIGDNLLIVDSRVCTAARRVLRIHGGDPGFVTELGGFFRNQWEGVNDAASSPGGTNFWIGPDSGTPPSGSITAIEFRNNRYYNQFTGNANTVMQIDPDQGEGVTDMIVVDNEFYCPDSSIDSAGVTGTFSPNTFASYTPPPAFSGGADH